MPSNLALSAAPHAIPGGQYQYLIASLHYAYATRSGAQMVIFKAGQMTNSYAAGTSSIFTPAISNLQNYGYCEQLRQQIVAYISEYLGGSYGPLTAAQINTLTTLGTEWGYTVTAAEANAVNGFLANSQVSSGVVSQLNTAGGFYGLLTFAQSFNTWVNWQSQPGYGQIAGGPIPSFGLQPLEPDDQQLGLQQGCGTLITAADAMAALAGMSQIIDPGLAAILSAIAGYLWLTGFLCETGAWQYYGGDIFVD